LEQMTTEFHQRYPDAHVLGIGSDDLKNDPTGEKRRDVIARAATGDYDAVILTQGAFKRIPVNSDTELDYAAAEAEPLRRSLERRRAEVDRQVREANPGLPERELQKRIRVALQGDENGKGQDPTVKDLEGRVATIEERVKQKQQETKRDPGLTFETT